MSSIAEQTPEQAAEDAVTRFRWLQVNRPDLTIDLAAIIAEVTTPRASGQEHRRAIHVAVHDAAETAWAALLHGLEFAYLDQHPIEPRPTEAELARLAVPPMIPDAVR